MYRYVELNWDANCLFPTESKDCMNSTSYEYRNMSARRGAQLVPIGMPFILWKTFPPEDFTFVDNFVRHTVLI